MSANTTVFEAIEAHCRGGAARHNLVLACSCGTIVRSEKDTYQDGYGTWCRECGGSPVTEHEHDLTKPFYVGVFGNVWSHGKCYGALHTYRDGVHFSANRKQPELKTFEGLVFGDTATAEDAVRRHLTKSAQ